MIFISHFVQRLSTSLYNGWSWWWKTNNSTDECILWLSTFIFILTASWYTWKLVGKSSTCRLPPGPIGLPVVGNLPFLDPELHSYFASLAKTYGPILTLRLGRKISVVISTPAMAAEVLKEHDAIFANRDVLALASAMEYGGHDIVFTPCGPEWRMLRKVCVRGMLGHAALDASYHHRRREMRNTIRYMYSQEGSAVNVGDQMFLIVLNVITSMLWGDTIHGEKRAGIGAEFRLVVTEMTELLGKPNISDFFPGLAWLDLQGMKKQMKVLTQKFDQIFDEIIACRIQMDAQSGMKMGNSATEKQDFLQVLLQLKNEGDAKTSLTMHHIKALLLDMVVGGTDTTSSTVEFAMAELMNKREIMKRAQQELDTVVGKNNIVEEHHIPKLPYLHAIMKEVLRLHPVLPLMVPHCPSNSCIIGGHIIPKGARVFINVWNIHRDPSIWKCPLEFLPERFLKGDGDYNRDGFSYLPYGSGRRICAGIAMAERMVLYSLASLLHSFDWKLPVDEKLDLSEKFGIVLKKKLPLVAIPASRLSDPTLYEIE